MGKMSEVYTIKDIREQESKLIAHITIDVKHAVFDGHFPQRSVLPGVLQLEMIKSVISQFFNRNYRLRLLKNAKYLAMVLPEQHQHLTIELDVKKIEEENLKVKAVIRAEQNVFLKFSGVFVEDHE